MSLSRKSGADDLLDALTAVLRDVVPQATTRRSDGVLRVALTPAEAAASLGCSAEFFREHVDPELHWVRRGRKRFVPLASLERWALDNAERTL